MHSGRIPGLIVQALAIILAFALPRGQPTAT